MSEPRPTYAVTEWHGCYDDSWNGVITPEALDGRLSCSVSGDYIATPGTSFAPSTYRRFPTNDANLMGKRLISAVHTRFLAAVVDLIYSITDRASGCLVSGCVSTRPHSKRAFSRAIGHVIGCVAEETIPAYRAFLRNFVNKNGVGPYIDFMEHRWNHDPLNKRNNTGLIDGSKSNTPVASPAAYEVDRSQSINSAIYIFGRKPICSNAETTSVDASTVIKKPNGKTKRSKGNVGEYLYAVKIKHRSELLLASQVEPASGIDAIISCVVFVVSGYFPCPQINEHIPFPLQIVQMLDAGRESYPPAGVNVGIAQNAPDYDVSLLFVHTLIIAVFCDTYKHSVVIKLIHRGEK